MKRPIMITIAVLLICMTVGSFIACGDEEAKGKSVEQVTSIFEDAGYNVASQTIAGISALVAVKSTDTITILFYENKKQATESKPTWDTAAQTAGQSCKQDNNNIYYGTAAAIALYEGASGGDPHENPDTDGDFVKKVTDTFEAQGYTVNVDREYGLAISGLKVENDEAVDMIFISVSNSLLEAEALYEMYRKDSWKLLKEMEALNNNLSLTCKRDQKIVYYGTAAAMAIYEGITVG